MLDPVTAVPKLATLALGVVVLLQLANRGDDESQMSSMTVSDGTNDPVAEPPPESRSDTEKTSGFLPDDYQVILSSGLFGKAPVKGAPAVPKLVRLIDGRTTTYALFRGEGGERIQIAVGEEKNGIKLIEVDTNRALVEFRDEKIELKLFQGLGGKPLLPEREAK